MVRRTNFPGILVPRAKIFGGTKFPWQYTFLKIVENLNSNTYKVGSLALEHCISMIQFMLLTIIYIPTSQLEYLPRSYYRSSQCFHLWVDFAVYCKPLEILAAKIFSVSSLIIDILANINISDLELAIASSWRCRGTYSCVIHTTNCVTS